MRKNKGYTLVELVVAVAVLLIVMAEVGALMVNSQHLYRNGFYEVNMQENAQQVIQQVQDLLMNTYGQSPESSFQGYVERTLSDVDGIPSDVITIHTLTRDYDTNGVATGTYSETTYRIGRDVDLIPGATYKGEGDKRYATLMLERTTGGYTYDPIPMAEGVKSISISTTTDVDPDTLMDLPPIMTNYDTADLVTLTVNMQNQQYSYSDTSEIYLRNQPGSHGPTVPAASTSTGADIDINVLRVHRYDLTDYVPDGYEYFKFDDDQAGELSSKYTLYGDNNKMLRCTSLNSSWGTRVNSGTIWAAKELDDGSGPDWANAKEISIHTDAVNNGQKLPIYGPDRSDDFVSVFPVTGICVCSDCVDSTQTRLAGQVWLEWDKVDLEVWWPTHTTITPEFYTLDSTTNFDVVNSAGDPYESFEELDDFKNRIFATGTTSINLRQPQFKIVGWTHKGSPYPHERGTSSDLNANYDRKGDMIFPTNSGAYAHVYDLQTIKDGTANAFALHCSDQSPQGQAYWDKFVDSDGYVRVKMSFQFKNGVPGTYTCYGYVFPKDYGSETQHSHLWDMMFDTAYDVEDGF